MQTVSAVRWHQRVLFPGNCLGYINWYPVIRDSSELVQGLLCSFWSIRKWSKIEYEDITLQYHYESLRDSLFCGLLDEVTSRSGTSNFWTFNTFYKLFYNSMLARWVGVFFLDLDHFISLNRIHPHQMKELRDLTGIL